MERIDIKEKFKKLIGNFASWIGKRFRQPEFVIPLVHFLLTFIWERLIFRFAADNALFNATTQARNNFPSQMFESVILYMLDKVAAAIIIVLIWRLIFAIIHKQIDRDEIIIFGTIYGIILLAGLSLFPEIFGLEMDNYTNYAKITRFLPIYWQSIYTGVIYAACIMTIPHPFAICIIQTLSFTVVSAYIYHGLKTIYPSSNIKFVSIILFLLPESYFIMFNAYRNDFYTILCLFYFAYIFFALHIGHNVSSIKQMIRFSAITAFVMIWRSEGIFIGIGGFIIMYWLVWHRILNWTLRRKVSAIVAVCLCFLCLRTFQNIGAKKYYGRDYMIINTIDVLSNILNNPANKNITEDEKYKPHLNALDAVIPIQILKEGQYRNYNWTQGRKNFNQTMATDEQAAKYMKAYYWMITHHIIDYLNCQLNKFFRALGVSANHKTFKYTGTNTKLSHFKYNNWRIGKDELLKTPLTAQWDKSSLRRTVLYPIFHEITTVWRELFNNTALNSLLHVISIIMLVFFAMLELCKLLADNYGKLSRTRPEFLIMFVTLLGELIGIMCFMPDARPQYLYPVLYSSYLVLFFYICDTATRRQSVSLMKQSGKQMQEQYSTILDESVCQECNDR